MRFTDEMKAEDEKRWHARDIQTELRYCSEYMRDRRDMTNLDIRFYAYLMRRAAEMLSELTIRCEGCTYYTYTEHKGWKYGDCKNCKESVTGHALRDPYWFCTDYLPRAEKG